MHFLETLSAAAAIEDASIGQSTNWVDSLVECSSEIQIRLTTHENRSLQKNDQWNIEKQIREAGCLGETGETVPMSDRFLLPEPLFAPNRHLASAMSTAMP